MSSNEVRQIVGLLPSDDPKANELRNKNINQTEGQTFPNVNPDAKSEEYDSEGVIQNG